VQPAQVVDVARDRAAPEADVDVRGVLRSLPLDLQAVDRVVGGMLLSGMSMIVVTPPAAAARVAVAKPSHWCGRVVDVHVAVDQAGQAATPRRRQVDGLGPLEPRLERLDRDHRPRRGRRCSGVPHRRG
jgi:hypothetical protein